MIPRELFAWLAALLLVAVAAHAVAFTQFRNIVASVEQERAARDAANAAPPKTPPNNDDIPPVPIVVVPPEPPGNGGGAKANDGPKPNPPSEPPPDSKPQPPLQPKTPTATVLGRSSIRVEWDPVDRKTTTGIEVQRHDGAAFKMVAAVSVGTTAWTDSGLKPGTEYQYRLVARGAVEPKAESAAVRATTAALPGPPTDVKVLADGTGGAKLTWKLPKDAEPGDSVEIERTNSSKSTTFRTEKGAAAFTDTGLTPGFTYTYRLRLVGEDMLETKYTGAEEFTLRAATPTPKPKKLPGDVLVVFLHTAHAKPTAFAKSFEDIEKAAAGRLLKGGVCVLDTAGLRERSANGRGEPFASDAAGMQAALDKLGDEVKALQGEASDAQFAVCILWHTPEPPTFAHFGTVKPKDKLERCTLIWSGSELRGDFDIARNWFAEGGRSSGPAPTDGGFSKFFTPLFPKK